MKPALIKPHLIYSNGYWWCGIPGVERMWSACARKPDEAYRLWVRGRE